MYVCLYIIIYTLIIYINGKYLYLNSCLVTPSPCSNISIVHRSSFNNCVGIDFAVSPFNHRNQVEIGRNLDPHVRTINESQLLEGKETDSVLNILLLKEWEECHNEITTLDSVNVRVFFLILSSYVHLSCHSILRDVWTPSFYHSQLQDKRM